MTELIPIIFVLIIIWVVIKFVKEPPTEDETPKGTQGWPFHSRNVDAKEKDD